MGCSFPCKRRGTLCEMRLINNIAHARAIGATRTSSDSLVIDLSHSFCSLRGACAKMALHTVPHEREAMHIDWFFFFVVFWWLCLFFLWLVWFVVFVCLVVFVGFVFL